MSIWDREKFPTYDLDMGYSNTHFPGYRRCIGGTSNAYNAKNRKPFCWTPVKRFYYGGKEFIPLYPCIAFESRNFGHVIQKRWDRMVFGSE